MLAARYRIMDGYTSCQFQGGNAALAALVALIAWYHGKTAGRVAIVFGGVHSQYEPAVV